PYSSTNRILTGLLGPVVALFCIGGFICHCEEAEPTKQSHAWRATSIRIASPSGLRRELSRTLNSG
ncbi:MAG: hypothetical protein U1B77_01980, partial [Dehalococcoidales bacterium]|nr:hypothetical protein [Dehalococcoidales bacterium]